MVSRQHVKPLYDGDYGAHVNWMRIEAHHCQRQTCRPITLVSEYKICVDISWGSLERTFNDSGVVENGD